MSRDREPTVVVEPTDPAYDPRVVAASRAYFYAERSLAEHVRTWSSTLPEHRRAWRERRAELTEAATTARLALMATARGQ